MLLICSRCYKTVGCVIGKTEVICGDNYECKIARVVELCENYPENKNRMYSMCDECKKAKTIWGDEIEG